MHYAIRKHAPLPKRAAPPGPEPRVTQFRYPLDLLDVGHSLIIPFDPSVPSRTQHHRLGAYVSWVGRKIRAKFATRKLRKGFGVWRIA